MRFPGVDALSEEARAARATLERLARAGFSGTSPAPGMATPRPAGTSAVLPASPGVPPVPHWSERVYRDLLESLPDAVVVIDATGAIVLVNAETEAIFGYSRAELVGRPIEILVPERFREGHVGQRTRYFTSPRSRPMGAGLALFGRRKDGEEFPVEISLSPLATEHGVMATSVIRDVSKRRREEAKFRTLVEHIPAVTFFAPLDESAPELYVSPQIEQMLGFSQKEWIEDPVLWHRQLHPEDRDRWNRQFAPTCAAGTPFRSVYRFLAKDGRVVWVHGSANLVRDAEGRPIFLQGVAFDVTSIKEAEEERERFFAVSVDLFCVAGLDGTFQRVNEAFTRTLGYAASELVGRPFLSFVVAEDQITARAELGRLASGEAAGFAVRFRCQDGATKWLQWAAAPYQARGVFYAAARDITRQRRDEEALREQEDSLRRLNIDLERRVRERTDALRRSMAELQDKTDELEQFAYVASHDLREPLRTLVNWPQRLAKEYAGRLDEQAEEWLRRIIDGARRMRQLIDDLSQYARVLRRDRAATIVETAAVVQEACGNLQAALEECSAGLHVGALPTVNGNPQQLMLLFQNLIGNAVKFRAAERTPRIEIGARRDDAGWLFWVRDNGIGIEAKYLRRIFGLGERLHAASKYAGTGFGLAICEKIVVSHGGRAWAESEPGAGSTFFFTLPDTLPAP